MRGEDCRVFDKCGIGKAQVRVKRGQSEPAFDKGLAIDAMLLEDKFEERAAKIDGRQTRVEVASRHADDGFGEQAEEPLPA